MKKQLFLLLMVACTGNLWALNVKVDGIWYELFDYNNTATVTSSYDDEYSGNVIIPSSFTYNNVTYSVTRIGAYAFSSYDGLTSIEIPNSVTTIKDFAFDGCSNLVSVTLNSNAIANKEFSSISTIKSIFGSQVTEYIIGDDVTSIGNMAFYNCTGVTSITIGNSVTSIGGATFEGCTGLTSVDLPNSVTIIGGNAFNGCTGLTSIIIPENVLTMYKLPFDGCTNLNTVIWNAVNCTTYDDGQYVYPPFQGCENITSFTIGENVQTLPRGLCYGMTISEISIPNGVTSIGTSAFRECSNLTSIEIPNSVTSIGNSAFYGCNALTSVTIPENVQAIGPCPFYGCANLDTVIWNAVNCTTYDDGQYIYPPFEGCENITSFTIGENVQTLPRGLCYKMAISGITIPNGVTNIGGWAFYGCTGLTSIEIPNNVNSIGESAFESCTNLTSLSLGKNITTYGDSVFAYCPNIESIYNYRQTPARLGNGVFRNVDYFNCTLYVLAGSIDLYKSSSSDWKDFYFIKPIGAATVSTDEIQVTPSDNSVDVVWPAVAGAFTYELIIKDKNGNVVCILIFNENGQLTQIAFNAPSHNGAPQQTQTAGFAFTVIGLDAGTRYNLTMTSRNSNGVTLETQTLSFTTTLNGETIEAIGQVSQLPTAKSQKLIKDGQILILRGEKTYTVTGVQLQ